MVVRSVISNTFSNPSRPAIRCTLLETSRSHARTVTANAVTSCSQHPREVLILPRLRACVARCQCVMDVEGSIYKQPSRRCTTPFFFPAFLSLPLPLSPSFFTSVVNTPFRHGIATELSCSRPWCSLIPPLSVYESRPAFRVALCYCESLALCPIYATWNLRWIITT